MSVLEQLNEQFIQDIAYLFTRATSAFLIIFGRRQTGKTDFGLLIAEIVQARGIIEYFASNIQVESPPFPITYITNLEDLRFWAKNTYGKKLFLFDEFGKAFRRRSPMSKLNVELIDDFQTLRKFKLSTIAMTVNEKYVDNTALGSDILDGIFTKPNYKNPKKAYYDDLLEYFHKEYYDLPSTTLKFDTWDPAPFKFHSPQKKPIFKEKDDEILWNWSHGNTCDQLGLHPMALNRIVKKFVKEVMERDPHVSQSLERAVSSREKESDEGEIKSIG